MRRLVTLVLLSCTLHTACHRPKPPMSQLQVRQMQTRTYDIKDTKRALKAVLNVLQDDAFIPRQADLDLGYVYAVKEVDVSKDSEAFWARFWQGRDARWRKNAIIECAANVTEIRDGMRVRVNFQVKTMNNRGEVMRVHAIDDPAFYQQFFSKVDKGIFYEKEGV